MLRTCRTANTLGRQDQQPFRAGPQGEYSQLCRPWGLCCSFSTLPSVREAGQTR